MTLVDTSTWIEYLEGRFGALAELLSRDLVFVHPWVLGELALGRLKNREQVLADLAGIHHAPLVDDAAVLQLIEDFRLSGVGIGWVDCQLLASARSLGVELLSHDKALRRAWDKVKRP